MCSIVGVISKSDADVSSDVLQMLRATAHRGPDGAGVALGSTIQRAGRLEELDLAKVEHRVGLGHSRLRITGDSGVQPMTGCNEGLVLALNGEVWDHADWREWLEARGHVFRTDSDAEVVLHMIEERRRRGASLEAAIQGILDEINGEYAFALQDLHSGLFYLARDVVGVKQLYYGESDERTAFGSEKKPLWDLGLAPQRVLPGQVLRLKAGGEIGGVGRVRLARPDSSQDVNGVHDALRIYEQALRAAVDRRVEGQPRVAVIFSGGVDSALVAALAARATDDVHCYATGFPGSPDVVASRRVAETMGLPLTVVELTESMIEAELGSILAAIESTDHLQADVAVPIYFAVQAAARDGYRVLLTGQGADELFAGYPWYPEVLAESGAEKLRECLWNDIEHLYKDTLEREDKITMYHSVELRVPFLDPRVITAAMAIPEDLKIHDGHVKYLHRKAAERLGVPDYVAWRPKEAAQHGSQVHEAMKRILTRAGENSGNGAGDRPAKPIRREQLGSAYRYDHAVYESNETFQRVLDSLGAKHGLQ